MKGGVSLDLGEGLFDQRFGGSDLDALGIGNHKSSDSKLNKFVHIFNLNLIIIQKAVDF